MRQEFAGYYHPSETEFLELWQNCVFVLDTSVLLNLYRFPQEARDDLLRILRAVSERVWLPYQVALEYQENRLQAIAEQVSKYREVRKVLEESRSKLESELNNLQLKKRHSRIKPEAFLERLSILIDEFLGELESLESEQPDVFDEDPIRQVLNGLFDQKVGPPPESQDALDAIYQEGETRYEEKRPPGYLDAKKENESLYGGLRYQGKFGDWLVWHQIITEANSTELTHVIFVTDDDKEDWWWVVNSKGKKTIGPRPELVAEIYAKTQVSLFYMYNSRGFMQFATNYLGIDVSEESIRQVHDIIEIHGYGLYGDDTDCMAMTTSVSTNFYRR